MVEIGVLFQRNIDEHQDSINLGPDDLEGLSPDYLEGLEAGEEKGTYKVGMAYPDVIPFMENSSRRDLRDDLLRRFNSRAVEANRPLLEEAIAHRQTIAELFGQPSWAHHQLEEKMAKTPEAVLRFYAGLVPGLTELGQTEKGKLAEMLGADGHDDELQSYDFRYYDTQLRKRDYGVDPIGDRVLLSAAERHRRAIRADRRSLRPALPAHRRPRLAPRRSCLRHR